MLENIFSINVDFEKMMICSMRSERSIIELNMEVSYGCES